VREGEREDGWVDTGVGDSAHYVAESCGGGLVCLCIFGGGGGGSDGGVVSEVLFLGIPLEFWEQWWPAVMVVVRSC